MEGWIRLHRKLTLKDLWLAEPFTRGQAWVDMLLLANYEDGYIRVRGNKVPIKRGQLGWSEVKLAERWEWSRNKVRRFLAELKSAQQIEQQNTFITSIITVVNYELYQFSGTANDTANDTADDTAERQQKDSRRYTKKEVKENKELRDTLNIEDTKKNKEKIVKTINKQFENIRKIYPGTKRGYEIEYVNFVNKWGDQFKSNGDYDIIEEGIERKKLWNGENRDNPEVHVPPWPNFKTYVNNRQWEEEFPDKEEWELG
ncbi:MAG TPA: hypothetical protein ENH82_03145 [bacterium]|nr:hypothetical protein [bacterium]